MTSATCDVAVIVPKYDELVGLGRCWDIDLDEPHGRLPSGKRLWAVTISNLLVIVAVLDEQGTGHARGVTEQLKARFNPPLLFLVGTAAGNEAKTRIGDVIVGSMVVDITESRAGDSKLSFRPFAYKPREPLDDAQAFALKPATIASHATGSLRTSPRFPRPRGSSSMLRVTDSVGFISRPSPAAQRSTPENG